MRKLFIFPLLFLAFLFLPSPLFAQTQPNSILNQKILPPRPMGNKGSFLGENHYYTVTFRGNGEAVVVAKVLLTNLDNPVNTVTIHFPANIHPQDLSVYQILQDPQCIQYAPTGEQPTPTKQPPCLEYQEPNYEYLYTNATYQKVPFEQNNNDVILHFPSTIAQNGAYVLYYRSFEYAQKNIFGAYNFTFESLKVDDKINALTLGINTDSDYILKGTSGNVNYEQGATTPAPAAFKSADTSPVNPSFSEFYNQIGQGVLVKNASNLFSNESYTTTGIYADSNIKLYGKEISITAIIILLTMLILFWIIKRIFHALSASKNGENQQQQQVSKRNTFFLAVGLGFVSVILLAMYTFCIVILANYISSLGYYQFNTFIMIFVFLISSLVYVFFLFTPAIIIGLQKGIRWGIATFGITICWTIVALFITLGVIFFFSSNNSHAYPPIYPMMSNPAMMKSDSGASGTTPQ